MPSTNNPHPENSRENLDRKLDHAIEETFPTSDPVSVTITKGGAIDYAADASEQQEGLAADLTDRTRRRSVISSGSTVCRPAQ